MRIFLFILSVMFSSCILRHHYYLHTLLTLICPYYCFDQIFIYYYFPSAWRFKKMNSSSSVQLTINSINFCLSEKVYISSSYFKIYFDRNINLGWFFSFNILMMWLHCLLAFKVFNEKFDIILIVVKLLVIF